MKRNIIIITASLLAPVIAAWFIYNKYRVVIPPVDTTKSEVGWSAKSVSDTHYGKIQLSKASLQFKDSKLAGGEFEVDMNSITVDDITDAKHNEDFIRHVTTEDFFQTNLYPTAKFIITSAKEVSNLKYEIIGDLTIKKVTKPIQFIAALNQKEKTKNVTATIVIDRTLFGIEYGGKDKPGSEKDWFIYNDFTLHVNIVSM